MNRKKKRREVTTIIIISDLPRDFSYVTCLAHPGVTWYMAVQLYKTIKNKIYHITHISSHPLKVDFVKCKKNKIKTEEIVMTQYDLIERKFIQSNCIEIIDIVVTSIIGNLYYKENIPAEKSSSLQFQPFPYFLPSLISQVVFAIFIWKLKVSIENGTFSC